MGTELLVGAAFGGMMSGGGGGGKIAAPPARSYLGETRAALEGQAELMPGLLHLERQFMPQWQQLQKDMARNQLGLTQQLYGDAAGVSKTLSNQMLDVTEPLYARAGRASMDAYNQMLGGSAGLMSMLEAQATRDMQAGGALTPQETMYAQQASRAALAARGLQGGNQAIALEALNDYNLSTAREQQRRTFAGQVAGAKAAMANSAYSAYGQPLTTQLFSMSPMGLITQGQAMQQGLGPQIFQPESQYMADVMGANQSNATQTNLANAQIKAGRQSGMMSMFGNIAGAYLSNEGLASSGFFND